ncbi:putative signal transduction protein with EAL and GGDEF domain [Methylobacterium sp. OAE515]
MKELARAAAIGIACAPLHATRAKALAERADAAVLGSFAGAAAPA